jgi:CDP-glucose 4,6-dehydratase
MEDLGMSMDFWQGRRVFVTGGGGFVGSWLGKALVERGASVTCLLLDRDRHSNLEVQGIGEQVETVSGDLVDFECVRRAIAESKADSVFHLAAQAIVGVANASPLPTFAANIQGTWNLLEAARIAGHVERIVVASSDKAYGDQPVLPYTEDLPLAALYPYDASKACADVLARSYGRTYDLPVAVTRMANIYGGADRNASRIVPGTIVSALRGENPVVRSDGTPLRDYMYVEDAVAAYLALAEYLPDRGLHGEAFNFGTKAPVSVLDLVNLIIERVGNPVYPDIRSKAKLHGEIDEQFLDSDKALRVLGWGPQVSLQEGIDRTIEWYREHSEHLVEAEVAGGSA